MPLEEDPGLTRGESSCIQLNNGRYLQQKEGTAVTGNFPQQCLVAVNSTTCYQHGTHQLELRG